MRRLQKIFVTLAALAAVVALGLILLQEPPPPEEVYDLGTIDTTPMVRSDRGAERPTEGGVYGGVVLNQAGEPIPGANVMLIAYDGGKPSMMTQGSGVDRDPDEIAAVPIVGRYKVGGEGFADAEGRFRIAADAQSMITRVLAYHEGYFLNVVQVMRPREDLVLKLHRGGRVVGTVLDDETGQPVPGALVDIYLQQKVSPIPEGATTYQNIKRKQHATSWLATLGRFVGDILGPRIWNVDSKGETLKLFTDKHGRFEIGPLGNSVQLEFVVTHAKYKWYDFDTEGGKHTPQRLVVEPGQTVERTFRLHKGQHVSGQVVDREGNGVPDVFVKVQSISAYYRHWWYRHKWRTTRTDASGRFRVDGLEIGSQQVVLQHPSFKEIVESTEAGTDDLLVVVEEFGGLVGTLDGVPRSRNRRRIKVMFESVEPEANAVEQFHRTVALQQDNTFLIERIAPGPYRVWVKAGKESSQPVDIEITSLEVARSSFEIGSGGALILRVVDEQGGLVDPASGRLVALRDGSKRAMGTFVTREGVIEVEGVAPGRYAFEARAAGRISATTEPFEIGADRVTNLGSITLARYGFVRFGMPVDRRGRAVTLEDELVIEYRRGEGAWKRLYNAGVALPLPPGALAYRARAGALRFEGSVDVVGGETVDARIVFDPIR